MLSTNNLIKIYNNRRVVNSVSINVKSGEIVGLLGPNGSGKTTSFYMLSGLIKPDSGSIFFGNHDITKLEMYKRGNIGITYLPQESSIFRDLTCKENIMIAIEASDIKKQMYEEELNLILARFNLEDVADTRAISLSGGECRRLEIARALVKKPKFLLLDEPLTGIDPITIKEITNMFVRLAHEYKIGIIITEHNVIEALKILDRAYIMHDGGIIAEGSPSEISKNKDVIDCYLGKDI